MVLKMSDLKKDKVIAIVGVSNDPDKYGFKIFNGLLNAGINATGVNPKGSIILGRKVYKSLKTLIELPELVITVTPPEVTEKIVDECHELGIRQIWMQPGSESKTAIEKAKEYGIMETHDACIMHQNGIW